jgi:hypothetical protein
MLRGLLIGVIALVVSAAAPGPASAQGARYALLVQGASGEPQYATLHRGWLDQLATLLREKYQYDEQHLILLAEQPAGTERRATAEVVRTTLGELANRVTATDQLIVILIGHGSNQGEEAKFNLIGPDLGVGEWKALLDPIKGRLAIVDTTSASFPFLAGLAAPNRVIITATSSMSQRFHTQFPDVFVQAFSNPEADLDKNDRVSLLEAFTFASKGVAAHYEQKGTMATETALLDDNGDGQGRLASAEGTDGSIVALTYLGGEAAITSDDPEVQRLLTRQRELTEQVDALRLRQSSMPTEEYQKQFEQLMIDLAAVSADVRRRTGG